MQWRWAESRESGTPGRIVLLCSAARKAFAARSKGERRSLNGEAEAKRGDRVGANLCKYGLYTGPAVLRANGQNGRWKRLCFSLRFDLRTSRKVPYTPDPKGAADARITDVQDTLKAIRSFTNISHCRPSL